MSPHPFPLTVAQVVRTTPGTTEALIRAVAAVLWSPQYATSMTIEDIVQQFPDCDALLVRWYGLQLLAHLRAQDLDGVTLQVVLTWRDDLFMWGESQVARHAARFSLHGYTIPHEAQG